MSTDRLAVTGAVLSTDRTHRRLRAAYRTLLVALALAACGGSPTPTPVVVPTPPPVTPTLDPNLGTIVFGQELDEATLTIPDPRTTFNRNVKKIGWVAQLYEAAGATSLTIVVASRSKTGVERTIVRQEVDVSNPDFSVLANRLDLALLLDRKPGTYVMRYLRESEVLAEGEFTLTR